MHVPAARWLVGLALIGLGVLFLLSTTDVIEGGEIWSTFWPLLLILLGAWFLVRERGRSLPGLVVLLLGVGFLAENREWIGEGWLGRYWPIAVIIVGLAILLQATAAPRPRPRFGEERRREGDWLNCTAILSGRKERVTSSAWQGGRATAVMGGVELDLRDAKPAEGGAILDVTAFMGGVEITVPRDWKVAVHGTPLLGAFENKTRGEAGVDAPQLEIVGTSIMGGVEVKD